MDAGRTALHETLPERGNPAAGTCDDCGHGHGCYVGGAVDIDDAGAIRWERHICLGCLMRATASGASAGCDGCTTRSGTEAAR